MGTDTVIKARTSGQNGRANTYTVTVTRQQAPVVSIAAPLGTFADPVATR